MKQPHILLTGANGFVGQALARTLQQQAVRLSKVGRAKASLASEMQHQLTSIDGDTDWSAILTDVDVVIHLAARVHVMHDKLADPLVGYRQINVDGTLNLARQAVRAKVRRFVFISSIKVNGERTLPGHPFNAEDIPAPEDPYGISKWEAEKGLLALAKDSGMEVVIIRPPLVYGAGVKGNFATMIKLVKSRLPLPFGAIDNRRSLVAIDNLISIIMVCVDHPAASNQVFLVSDGDDLSTTFLLLRLAQAGGLPSRLIPVPEAWLEKALSLLGRRKLAQRVLGSLQVDISKARALLGWSPPLTVDQGLQRCFSPEAES